MSQTLSIGELPFLQLAGRAATGQLACQTGVRVRLDVQNVVPAGLVDLPDVGRVGVERVLDQDQLQVGITSAQPGQQALGGVALAIVLGRAVLFEERLEVQGGRLRRAPD